MRPLLAGAAAVCALALSGCGGSPPPGRALSPSADRACLAPIEKWESDPALRDVTLIQDAGGGVTLKACIVSDRAGPLAFIRADVRLLPKDGGMRCGTPAAPAYCSVGDYRTNVGPTMTPMPLMPQTVAVLSRGTGLNVLPADLGPVQPRTTATISWAPCLDAACTKAGPTMERDVPVNATVIQK